SCRRDALTSFVFAWLAHRKHSSAMARYSAAVFMGTPPSPIQRTLPQFCSACTVDMIFILLTHNKTVWRLDSPRRREAACNSEPQSRVGVAPRRVLPPLIALVESFN